VGLSRPEMILRKVDKILVHTLVQDFIPLTFGLRKNTMDKERKRVLKIRLIVISSDVEQGSGLIKKRRQEKKKTRLKKLN